MSQSNLDKLKSLGGFTESEAAKQTTDDKLSLLRGHRGSFQPGEAPQTAINEAHPDVAASTRQLIMFAGGGPDIGLRHLQKQGFDVEPLEGANFAVRKPGEKHWRKLEKEGLDVQDPLDIVGDVVSLAGMGLGAAATSPGLATTAAGAAGGSALAQSARTGVGKALGLEVSAGEAGRDIAVEGALGGAAALLGPAAGTVAKGIGAAIKHGPTGQIARYGGKLIKDQARKRAGRAGRLGEKAWKKYRGNKEAAREAAETRSTEAAFKEAVEKDAARRAEMSGVTGGMRDPGRIPRAHSSKPIKDVAPSARGVAVPAEASKLVQASGKEPVYISFLKKDGSIRTARLNKAPRHAGYTEAAENLGRMPQTLLIELAEEHGIKNAAAKSRGQLITILTEMQPGFVKSTEFVGKTAAQQLGSPVGKVMPGKGQTAKRFQEDVGSRAQTFWEQISEHTGEEAVKRAEKKILKNVLKGTREHGAFKRMKLDKVVEIRVGGKTYRFGKDGLPYEVVSGNQKEASKSVVDAAKELIRDATGEKASQAAGKAPREVSSKLSRPIRVLQSRGPDAYRAAMWVALQDQDVKEWLRGGSQNQPRGDRLGHRPTVN